MSALASLREGYNAIGRLWQLWHAARAQEQHRQSQQGNAHKQKNEFLPAVMEIQETPPAPHGRAMMYLIVSVVLITIFWASIGKIDIITIAQGKIIPSDYSKVIQPLESGIVKAIHVNDGQYVKAGDVLIEMDATLTTADQERLQHELNNAKVEAARLRSLIDESKVLNAPADSDAGFVTLQQQLLNEQLAEWHSKKQSAKLLVDQRDAALQVTLADIRRLETTVPLIVERAKSTQGLVEKGYVSRAEYLKMEEERVNKEQELAMQRHKVVQDQAAVDEARRNLQTLVANFKQARQAELSQIETRITSMGKDELKATTRNQQQTLIAPIDGYVQQLSIHTVGGVVTPAQQLMVIAPKQGQLEVEALVENMDIGFVNSGQVAEIKVEAFPFTQYGVIPGTLQHLSQDAVPVDKKGYMYTARVSMAKTTIDAGNKHVNLTPGMNVSVEIKTGERRVIEYFLNPILKGFKESARER